MVIAFRLGWLCRALTVLTVLLQAGCVTGMPPGTERRILRHTGSELIHESGMRVPDRSVQGKEEVTRSGDPSVRQSPRPFSYDSYCDEHGRFTYDGAAEALVLQSEHLRQVYLDASRGLTRAQELVRELEEVFSRFGVKSAEITTRPACLPLPELTPQCTPNWRFLQEFLGTTPEADHLREVAARAYEARARERGVQNAVLVGALQLLWAGRMVDAAIRGPAPVSPPAPASGALAGEAGPTKGEQKLLPANAGPTAHIHASEVAGKTPTQIDSRARQLGLQPRGPDPANGRGAYVDPQTGIQRLLSHPDASPPHGHVNNSTGQRIGADGRVVPHESPEAHLPITLPGGLSHE